MSAMKYRDLIKYLESLGAVMVRRGKGSHVVYRLGNKQTIIPKHSHGVPAGTLRDIFKQLGIDYKRGLK